MLKVVPSISEYLKSRSVLQSIIAKKRKNLPFENHVLRFLLALHTF